MWVLHPKSKKHLQYSIYIGIRFIRQFQNRAQAPPENLVSHNIFSELPALRLGLEGSRIANQHQFVWRDIVRPEDIVGGNQAT